LPELIAQLDLPLPGEVATGAGSAIFLCGWCYSPQGRLHSLQLTLDGVPQRLLHHSMPRLDPYLECDQPLAYHSGFWGILRLLPPEDGRPATRREIGLRAELGGGGIASAVLGEIWIRRELEVAALPAAHGPRAAGERIAICMATHEPSPELLRAQLQSIREQTHRNWICCISDDASSPAGLRTLRDAIDGDERFVLDPCSRRLGFYRNFERALALAPADAPFVALSDQDDRWYPNKLERLLAAIGDAPLIYSDARIIARDGGVIAESYWTVRRNNHTDLLSLLSANAVTGAATLLRSELLRDALPFPPDQFAHYHDHWLALVARCLGEIRYLPEPLYDYVQHGEASLGHAQATSMSGLSERLRGLRTRGARERIRLWRLHYFLDVMRLVQAASVLEMRIGERMRPQARASIEALLGADRSLVQMVRLLYRGAAELSTRTPETLGAELTLGLGLLWRRLATATAAVGPGSRLRIDALPPTDLAPRSATAGGAMPARAARQIAEKVAPLRWRVQAGSPTRVNLLIPCIDLDHLFAGYIAKFNLALALARRGHRVRIVTVDPGGRPRGDWARALDGYEGLAGFGDAVEVAFGRESASEGIEASAEDRFIATTWWTAHIARDALAQLGSSRRFLYLIQEYEPFTFPMGTYAALAAESYTFEHAALYSTELLRGWFAERSIGVFAAGAREGQRASASFRNAITPVPAPTAAELSARSTRRLLFYARPEPHAARNLFELGVLALERVAGSGALAGWELHGIGSIRSGARISLGGGATLSVAQRAGQDDYARLLREHDVGLALMYTPHPSLVPLEMASAGMLTVTSTFEGKPAAALAAISTNLIAAPPTIGGVAAGLERALGEVHDADARARGARFDWPRSWPEALDEQRLRFVEDALGLRS
jgi:glycosyltransferase involved in cell wall biosynthesis